MFFLLFHSSSIWQGGDELKRIELWTATEDIIWIPKDFIDQIVHWYNLFQNIVQRGLFRGVFKNMK